VEVAIDPDTVEKKAGGSGGPGISRTTGIFDGRRSPVREAFGEEAMASADEAGTTGP
jgi:hypothetical protein